MNEAQLKKMIAIYQQKLADATAECIAQRVLSEELAEENAALREQLRGATGAPTEAGA